MEYLSQIKFILENIWGTFFAWMPLSLQIIFGVLVAVSLMIMVIRLVGVLMDAIPFV